MPLPIVSEVFCCGECHSPVALVMINPDDLCYCCTNDRCSKAVSVDCPEALALAEDVRLELAEAVGAAFAPVFARLQVS